jgi:hypothetical protein
MSEVTLADIWHAASTERNFNYVFWIDKMLIIVFENTVRACGKFMVFCAIVLILAISLGGFGIILPAIARPYTLWFAFNVVWGELVIISSYLAVFQSNSFCYRHNIVR